MKLSEMRERSIEELNTEIVNMRKRLFELRLQKATFKLENVAQIPQTKNIIAQLKTVIREKQLQK